MYSFVDINKKSFVLLHQVEAFYSIFQDVIIGKKYLSPFRIDTNPNCYFQWFNNKLYFIDWGDYNHHRDIFKSIMDFFNIDFTSSINFLYNFLINNDFSRVFTKENRIDNKINSKKIKDFTKIKINKRYYNDKDVEYWKQWGLSLKDLVHIPSNYTITPIKSFEIKNRKYIADLGYAYEFDKKYLKIYNPLSKKWKWRNNTPKDVIGIVKFSNDELIITKSIKESAILSKMKKDNIVVQSEIALPNDEILVKECKKYQKVKILFDTDETGIKQSELLKKKLNSYNINATNIILNIKNGKDSADFVKEYGINGLNEVLCG